MHLNFRMVVFVVVDAHVNVYDFLSSYIKFSHRLLLIAEYLATLLNMPCSHRWIYTFLNYQPLKQRSSASMLSLVSLLSSCIRLESDTFLHQFAAIRQSKLYWIQKGHRDHMIGFGIVMFCEKIVANLTGSWFFSENFLV